jgi:two-component system sensor histidine kinase PhoQ
VKILERGVRADQSLPGHGIGLAIVRDIIQVYDGVLAVDQTKTKGTRITITMKQL